MNSVTHSKWYRHDHRCGGALLIVLACLVIVIPICAGVAMQAAVNCTSRKLNRSQIIADDLGYAAETGPIQHWLNNESSNVVLPVDVKDPRIDVINDRWVILNNSTDTPVECELQITAWDQCGMVSWLAVQGSSPLRMTLPSDVLNSDVVRHYDTLDTNESIGLDTFYSVSLRYQNKSKYAPVFPSVDIDSNNYQHAIGSMIATHQPRKYGSININTVPIQLLESAMLLAGRGGMTEIIEARTNGIAANISADTLENTELSQTAPVLLSTSNVWSFRIDIKVDMVQRSWWVVYSKSNTKNNWECIQRLVIPE